MKLKLNNTVWTLGIMREKDDPDTWGITHTSKLTINISDGLSLPNAKTTITHEVVHAYLFSHGFTQPTHETAMLFSEEQTCDFIAMNIDNIMDASRKVYQWYLKETKKGKKAE